MALSWQPWRCLRSPRQGRPPNLLGGLLHILVRAETPAQASQRDQGAHPPQEPCTEITEQQVMSPQAGGPPMEGAELTPPPLQHVHLLAPLPTWAVSDLDRAGPGGRAVSGSALPSHCALPGARGRRLLPLGAGGSCSSGSGSQTRHHRSWSRGSTRTTHTKHLGLGGQDAVSLRHANVCVCRRGGSSSPGQGSLEQFSLPPSQVLGQRQIHKFVSISQTSGHIWPSHKGALAVMVKGFVGVDCSDQLLHPSGASLLSPGASVCPVLRSRQGHSSLSTHTVPLADRSFPSVQ